MYLHWFLRSFGETVGSNVLILWFIEFLGCPRMMGGSLLNAFNCFYYFTCEVHFRTHKTQDFFILIITIYYFHFCMLALTPGQNTSPPSPRPPPPDPPKHSDSTSFHEGHYISFAISIDGDISSSQPRRSLKEIERRPDHQAATPAPPSPRRASPPSHLPSTNRKLYQTLPSHQPRCRFPMKPCRR